MKLSWSLAALLQLITTVALSSESPDGGGAAPETADLAPPQQAAPLAPATAREPEAAPFGSPTSPARGYQSVVSATRSPRDPMNLPVGTSVVRREEIARRPAATTAELLRDQPGIWTNGEGLINVGVNLRGALGVNQTVFLVDGVRLNNVLAISGPNQLFQGIDPESVGRIEVVRGSGSVMWGSDALGGTVSVFTLPPPEFNLDGVTWSGRLSATLGSVDRLQRYHGEAGVSTSRFRARAGITSTEVGDLVTAGPRGVLSPSGWHGRALDGRVDVRLRTDDVLTLQAQEVRTSDIQSWEISYTRPAVSEGLRRLVLLRYESRAPLTGVGRLDAWGYFNQQTSLSHQLSDGKDTSSSVLTGGLDVQAQSRIRELLQLTYGVHFHADVAESRDAIGARRSRSFPDSRWLTGAAFALGDLRPVRFLSLIAGARLDVSNLATSPLASDAPAGLKADDLRIDTTAVAPTGSLALIGRATRWLHLVASASRGFRSPNVNDQVSSGPFRNGYNYPSPGLSPEVNWTLEGGLRLRYASWIRAEVTGWYTWFENQITSVLRNPDLNSDDCVDINMNGKCDANEHVFVRKNAGRAHSAGVEVAARVDLPYDLSASLVGTWMTARQDDTNQLISFLQPMNATVTLRWEPRWFWVEAYARLVAPISSDDIPCTRVATDGGFRADPRDISSPLIGDLKVSSDGSTCSGSYPGYATFGARAGVHLWSIADLTVTATNLTNAAYRDKDARWDGPGFGIHGTLALRLPE